MCVLVLQRQETLVSGSTLAFYAGRGVEIALGMATRVGSVAGLVRYTNMQRNRQSQPDVISSGVWHPRLILF